MKLNLNTTPETFFNTGIPTVSSSTRINYSTLVHANELVQVLQRVDSLDKIVDIAFDQGQVFIRFEHPIHGESSRGVELYFDMYRPGCIFIKTTWGQGDSTTIKKRDSLDHVNGFTKALFADLDLAYDNFEAEINRGGCGIKFPYNTGEVDLDFICDLVERGQRVYKDLLEAKRLQSVNV